MSAPAANAVNTQPLDLEAYEALDLPTLGRRVQAVRDTMGSRLLILGHHYQRNEAIAFSDLQGDSYKLSASAAADASCEAIVFCGVHFMAETADILANRPEQLERRAGRRIPVVLPDLAAGCPMADMADIDQVEECWRQLGSVIDLDEVTPVTYINSAANLKAFCGRHGGIVCTSSNARAVLDWALARRPRVLFFPDQHLGRNTALAMGVPPEAMPLWDPDQPELGGNTEEAIRGGRVLLWRGHCYVHQFFLPEHAAWFKQADPDVKLIVHPECMKEVVEQANVVGSTGAIVQAIESAPPGTRWAVGTELHLVNRLKEAHPEQAIYFLSPTIASCRTMSRIDLPHLCWALENLAAGTPVNVVRVPDAIAQDALVALQRMLEVSR
ncbi:MAG: quinolinate synthase NadA [Pirellulales bacterium]|nr:quinolinate synthase NadA [Pirellulales bacterium]